MSECGVRMKPANMLRSGCRSQVYSIGNYLMTGKVLGKGHFATVEEATHTIIRKKVAIKIVDLTQIKEEYARRNLLREPRVMARLSHPCIAALYETMLHGPRLYVVMEAARGGDLCGLVLAGAGGAGGRGRGLSEPRARPLAAQLVSAVRHMHARGVVHRDLKMENIMLDSTKQFIKIVDFGLSNVWSAGGALSTPCGSLEYAAPELFVGGHRYGPEVDLWSVGVIVFGMVTGTLPFAGSGEGQGAGPGGGPGGGSRPLLRAAIARGFGRKQRAALAAVSTECKTFIQHLLEPNVELRMKVEEASRHRWLCKPALTVRTRPLPPVEPTVNREIYRQISELNGQSITDVVAQIKAEPYGATAGIYNIQARLHQLRADDNAPPAQPAQSAPPAQTHFFSDNILTNVQKSPATIQPSSLQCSVSKSIPRPKLVLTGEKTSSKAETTRNCSLPNRVSAVHRPLATSVAGTAGIARGAGDGRGGPRLPRIEEQAPAAPRTARHHDKRTHLYRTAGDGLQRWRASGGTPSPAGLLLVPSDTAAGKPTSLRNIVSPNSSTNSHCKSERAIPVWWRSARGAPPPPPAPARETPPLQRFRRTASIK